MTRRLPPPPAFPYLSSPFRTARPLLSIAA